jgi:hypothetical protein
VCATVGSFIAKRNSLGDGQDGTEGNKWVEPLVERLSSGKAAERGRTKWDVEEQAN